MTFPSRQTRREWLKEILENEGSWQAAYDHQPASFEGQSPAATVHSGAMDWANVTGQRGVQVVTMEFLVTNFVKRHDPAAAEDQLDSLLATVVELVNLHRQALGKWDDLRIVGPTEPDYYLVDGEQYRGELIRVEATIYHAKN